MTEPVRPKRRPSNSDLEWVPSGQPGGPGWRVTRGPSAGYVYRTDRPEPRTGPRRRFLGVSRHNEPLYLWEYLLIISLSLIWLVVTWGFVLFMGGQGVLGLLAITDDQWWWEDLFIAGMGMMLAWPAWETWQERPMSPWLERQRDLHHSGACPTCRHPNAWHQKRSEVLDYWGCLKCQCQGKPPIVS